MPYVIKYHKLSELVFGLVYLWCHLQWLLTENNDVICESKSSSCENMLNKRNKLALCNLQPLVYTSRSTLLLSLCCCESFDCIVVLIAMRSAFAAIESHSHPHVVRLKHAELVCIQRRAHCQQFKRPSRAAATIMLSLPYRRYKYKSLWRNSSRHVCNCSYALQRRSLSLIYYYRLVFIQSVRSNNNSMRLPHPPA